MILIADSIDPAAIPDSFAADRNRGVMPYATGPHAWTHRELGRYPRRTAGIDVNATDPTGAVALDVERYDATADDWPGWRAKREHALATGAARGGNATVYCSINPGPPYGVADVLAACTAAGQAPPDHWWIAWYTPGGQIPTALQVAQQVTAIANVVIDPSTIWGCQYATMPDYDLTVCYQSPAWLT